LLLLLLVLMLLAGWWCRRKSLSSAALLGADEGRGVPSAAALRIYVWMCVCMGGVVCEDDLWFVLVTCWPSSYFYPRSYFSPRSFQQECGH
jgi:hypothetical protein